MDQHDALQEIVYHHLYDEETSRKIYKEIKENYIKLLEKLNQRFETLL